MDELAPIIAGGVALLVAVITGLFAWINQTTGTSAPATLASGFSSLVDDLQNEIVRLNRRVDALELQRTEDIRHLAYLELQVEWLSKRIDEQTRAEFEAMFRPFK